MRAETALPLRLSIINICQSVLAYELTVSKSQINWKKSSVWQARDTTKGVQQLPHWESHLSAILAHQLGLYFWCLGFWESLPLKQKTKLARCVSFRASKGVFFQKTQHCIWHNAQECLQCVRVFLHFKPAITSPLVTVQCMDVNVVSAQMKQSVCDTRVTKCCTNAVKHY